MNFQFQDLLVDLHKQKLIPPSQSEVPEDAEIIGELPKDLQLLNSRMVQTRRKLEQAMFDLRHSDDEELSKELKAAAIKLKSEHDLLNVVFWYEVRCNFNVFGDEAIELDKNWQLYLSPKPEDILSRLLRVVVPIETAGHCDDPNCPCQAGQKAN